MQFKAQENEADLLAEKEAEYAQLKLSLHLAQSDREHYMEQMQTSITKMKNVIDQLESERVSLLEQITAVDSNQNRENDQRTCEDLANFAENKDWLQEQIAREKAKHIELDAKARDLERHLRNLANNSGSTFHAQQALDKLRRKKTNLEVQLSHELKLYNEALGRNTMLQTEIDTLRMERGRFDLIYRKLDVTLHKMQTEINRLTATTTHTYNKREEAAARTKALIEKAERDRQQHNMEMKELVRLIDHERKLKEFMKVKSAEREEDPQLTAYNAKKAQEAEEKKAEVESSIKRYEADFNKILTMTNETNIDNIMKHYNRNDDCNFALYDFVKELDGKIEGHLNENTGIMKSIRELKKWISDSLVEQRNQLSKLEERKRTVEKAKEKVGKKLAKTKIMLDQAQNVIGSLVHKLRCDTTELTRRLDAPESVNTETLLDYQGLAEAKVDKLLLVRQYVSMTDPNVPFIPKQILNGGNLKPVNTAAPNIVTPNLGTQFTEATTDESHAPMSREGLHNHVVSMAKAKDDEMRNMDTID